MIAADKNRFAQALGTLRDCYPSYRPNDEDWKRVLRSYWERLEALPIEAVEAAVMRAPDAEFYPDWFPAAGQLKRVATEAHRDIEARKARERDDASRPVSDPEEELRDFHRTVPMTPDGQAAFLAEASDDWDKLSRLWLCESRRLRLRPSQTTPREVFAQRMQDFWALWNRKTETNA